MDPALGKRRRSARKGEGVRCRSCLAGLLFLLAGCSTLPPVHFSRVVVFGDSNADNGNLLKLSFGRVPAPPRWQGRESNGPVAVEYLAGMLRAELMDFAVSGATTGSGNVMARLWPNLQPVRETGLAQQIGEFTSAGAPLRPTDLVIVWAGSNDLFGISRQSPADLARRIGETTHNVEQAIWRLKIAGASAVVVAGRTPRQQLGSDDDLNGRDLNRALQAMVGKLRRQLQIDLVYFDVYEKVADMVRNPQQYGFTEVQTACIEVPACRTSQEASAGRISDGYINWDRFHKTTRVHELLARSLMQELAARRMPTS